KPDKVLDGHVMGNLRVVRIVERTVRVAPPCGAMELVEPALSVASHGLGVTARFNLGDRLEESLPVDRRGSGLRYACNRERGEPDTEQSPVNPLSYRNLHRCYPWVCSHGGFRRIETRSRRADWTAAG